MRNKFIASATLAVRLGPLAVATAVPSFSQAQPERHRVRVCRDVSSRGARNTGTAVGAVGGALAGNALASGGGKTGGTILGAVAGGVIGHQVAKHNATHRVCHWEYR